MKTGIIDRFEGQYALVEIAGNIRSISRRRLPEEAREGDVIVLQGRKWKVDQEATQERQNYLAELAENLWK
ncbi:MAG: DUF3006 domain-containing protein [Syntrophomonadaceae bacterium]